MTTTTETTTNNTTTSATKPPAKKKTAAPAKKTTKAAAKKAPRQSYSAKHIRPLVKLDDTGLRAKSKRAAMLAAVLKAKNTDDVLGKTVTVKGKAHEITGANLAFMVAHKFIALSA